MISEFVNLVFGIKVRKARMEANLTASEFAKMANISPSYLTEIEKGRKHPKADKIMQIANALGKEYDELVSIKLGPDLLHLEKMLSSPIIHQFPFALFGLEKGDVIELFSKTPKEASAVVHAISEMARFAGLEEEHLFRAILRSYQEIHHNYFPEEEQAAQKFMELHKLSPGKPVPLQQLELILTQDYGYTLDDTRLHIDEDLSHYRSIFIEGKPHHLLTNAKLNQNQIKFLLARELGYQYLELEERSVASTPDEVNSFEQVLNDFKASYFGGALLMPESEMVADLGAFFSKAKFQEDLLRQMITKYDVTPEMLFYRFSELIPQFFGIPVHFLRTHWDGTKYSLYKYLNMTNLVIPAGLRMREHYCRRWLSISVLNDVRESEAEDVLHIDVQASKSYNSNDEYLCIGFGRKLKLDSQIHSSVIIGMRKDKNLTNVIHFLEDEKLSDTVLINETCERCPLSEDECDLRAAAPIKWDQVKNRTNRWEKIKDINQEIADQNKS